MSSHPRLPEASPEELAHSAALAGAIRAQIERDGPMDFARYMQLCLYAPGLGYYSAGKTKFGAAGDFTTAPEMGTLFARCLARALAPVLRATAGDLLELGGGSGALAASLLPALQALDALPLRYRMLDTSADLRERQAERVATLAPELRARVDWLSQPPQSPWRGVLVANEVLDALPVRRFVLRAGALMAQCVGVDGGGGFAWRERPPDAELGAAVARLIPDAAAYPNPYRSEWLPALDAWLVAVLGELQQGAAWFVDYGHARRDYYAPSRREGTLACHYRHRVHDDPLILPGLQDLTAWVDFTALAEAGARLGFGLAGYASQAQFLMAQGLPAIFAESAGADAAATYRLAQEVKRLTLPSEMGERFKVMTLARGLDRTCLPEPERDERHRL